MKTRTRCKGINITLTTPSGTYDVRLPKGWKGVKLVSRGDELRYDDRALCCTGEFLQIGSLLRFLHPFTPRVSIGGYPYGYYFRKVT